MRQLLQVARPLLGLVVAVLPLGLVGCAPPVETADNLQRNDDVMQVVSTTTQLCDYVTQLAGDHTDIGLVKIDSSGKEVVNSPAPQGQLTVALTCLLAPNASAHEHEMTPKQMKALGDADLFVINGVDLERYLEPTLQSAGFTGMVVDSSGQVPQRIRQAASANGYTLASGLTEVPLQPWPFGGSDGEDFTHDPHLWTAVPNAMLQVNNVARTMREVRPQYGQQIEQQEQALLAQYKQLHQWVIQAIDTVPANKRVLFTTHDAFGYFANAYNIKFIGAALTDFNSQADATAAHISEAVDTVRDAGAPAIFGEHSASGKSLQAVGEAAGVPVITGDDALYGDSLGVPGSDGETYAGSIKHNVSTIVSAWGGTVPPPPN